MSTVTEELFSAADIDRTEAEAYLAKRLRDHHAHIYPVSPAFPAKERFRQAILDAKLDCTVIGRNKETGKAETYAQAWERLYREQFKPKGSKK